MRIINEKDEEAIVFFNKNIKKLLEDKLKKVTGIQFNLNLSKARTSGVYRVRDETNQISKIGAFAAVLEEIHVEGLYYAEKTSGYIDFDYTSKSGGHNGLTIFNFYMEKNKLIARDESGKTI